MTAPTVTVEEQAVLTAVLTAYRALHHGTIEIKVLEGKPPLVYTVVRHKQPVHLRPVSAGVLC